MRKGGKQDLGEDERAGNEILESVVRMGRRI